MKKILVILVSVILLTSCRLALGGSIPAEHNTPIQSIECVSLDCIDMFSVNGKGYTTIKTRIPVLVYNPNLYTIDITVNGSAILTLESHEEKRLH